LEFVKKAVSSLPQPAVYETKPETEPKPEEEKKEETEKTETGDGIYDVIILDISDPSGKNISPPGPFRELEFLGRIKKILKKNCLFIVNVIVSDNIKLEQVMKEFNKVFDVMYLSKAEDELNHVLFAMNIDFKRDRVGEQEVIVAKPEKLMDKKKLETSFKQMVKAVKPKWDLTMNVESYCTGIQLKYPMLNVNPLQMTNAVVSKNDTEFTNKTKELYLEDKEKVTKEKRKKKRK
jgi:hypothetical protein